MSDEIQFAAALSRHIEYARSILLGIALGDAADHLTKPGPRPVGVATQLTLATTEGMIRAIEAGGQGQEVDGAEASLEALRRWAVMQGISGVTAGTQPGVLRNVPSQALRRGNAPATVRTLRGAPGMPSFGPHGLVRVLPLASMLSFRREAFLPLGITSATATHSHDLMAPTVAVGLGLVHAATMSDPSGLPSAWEMLLDDMGGLPDIVRDRLVEALMAGLTNGHNPSQLRQLAPDGTALSVLAAAMYAVLSHPLPHELPLALALASFSPDKDSTSAVVGAILGALHGSTVLLEHGAAQLECAWACEALGTDLAMTSLLTPLGQQEDGSQWLTGWTTRYPR